MSKEATRKIYEREYPAVLTFLSFWKKTVDQGKQLHIGGIIIPHKESIAELKIFFKKFFNATKSLE